MSFKLGGHGIVSGVIYHPARGAYTADIEIATDQPLTGKQSLELPGLTLSCTVENGGVSGTHQRLRLVGGAGGLGKTIEGQHFNQSSPRDVVRYLLTKAGEQLSADSDAAILDGRLEHWQHVRDTAAHGMDRLVAHLGTYWYVTPEGHIRIGDPGWALFEPEHQLLDEDLVSRAWTVATLADVPRPGTTFRGERVALVEHTIRSTNARSIVVWDAERHPFDEDLHALVRHFQIHTLPSYEAQVETMNDDGTVDLKPTSRDVGPGWKHVEIALQGLFQVKVQPECRCILEFLDNDRSKPIVRQFLPGTTFTEAVMQTGAEAARKGDGTGWLVITPQSVAALGDVFVKTVAWSPTDPAVVPPVIKIPLSITGGSSIVKKVA